MSQVWYLWGEQGETEHYSQLHKRIKKNDLENQEKNASMCVHKKLNDQEDHA
jgi:hypothetical protein